MSNQQRNIGKARQGGFTFMEMVIAISIVSIMVTAVFFPMSSGKMIQPDTTQSKK